MGRNQGGLEDLYWVIKLLLDAKRQGTWRATHNVLVTGLIFFVLGIVGFVISLVTHSTPIMPLFLGLFIIGVLLSSVSLFIIRVRSGSNKLVPSSPEEAGKEGERHTAHQLEYLGREYKVYNHIYLQHNGKQQEIDHIAIGHNGVFHIESKAYSGNLSFSATGLSKNGQPVEDPTGQVYRHQFILDAILKDAGISSDVVGVICFSHPNCTLSGSSPKFITCKADRLIHSIVSYQPQTRLDSAAMERASEIIQAYIKQKNTNLKRA
jgi:Predicted membrane protein